MENFPQGCDRTVLKISQYPLPKELIRKVMDECDEVLILEDGQPFVEEQLRGLLDESGKVKGRLTGELPRVGELTPDNVRAALGFEMEKQFEASKNIVPPRPPALCSGCGHSDVYKALNEVVEEYKDAKVFSDIGCYTLGHYLHSGRSIPVWTWGHLLLWQKGGLPTEDCSRLSL